MRSIRISYNTHLLRQFRTIIGRNIRHLRTEHALTLDTLARLSGVSASLIDRYELGKTI